jgi:hypothetical protein
VILPSVPYKFLLEKLKELGEEELTPERIAS